MLIATSVAEEGMDIPAANCVVRFDEVQTPESLVQSRGRARQEDSTFVVMKESCSRPVSDLYATEQQQIAVIASINRVGVTSDDVMIRNKLQAQLNRNRNAASVISKFFYQKPLNASQPVAIPNAYSQKVANEVTFVETKTKTTDAGVFYQCSATFVQFGEPVLHGTAASVGKKEGRQMAALRILEQLRFT